MASTLKDAFRLILDDVNIDAHLQEPHLVHSL